MKNAIGKVKSACGCIVRKMFRIGSVLVNAVRPTQVEFYLIDAFEIYHFLPLYNFFRSKGINACFVAESCHFNPAGKWFNRKTAVDILKSKDLKYRPFCNPNAKIAFTTQESRLLGNYSKNTAHICISYGFAFIKSSFGFSRRRADGFDYQLVHGDYYRRFQSQHMDKERIMVMGYPKHFGKELPERAVLLQELKVSPSKKILVYFPTWDADCSVSKFCDEIEKLRGEYFIITKLHHVLARLESKEKEREQIRRISDVVLDGNYDFESAVALADIALVDAKSGASAEVPYLNPSVTLVLLSVKEDIESNYYPEMSGLGPAISNPSELPDAIEKSLQMNICDRARLVEDVLGKKNQNYLVDLFPRFEQIINDRT